MNRPTWAWVQATTLGLDAISDGRQLLVWTTDLTTGEPRPGVEVTALGGSGGEGADRTVTTDDHGVATVPLGSGIVGLSAADPGRARWPRGPGRAGVVVLRRLARQPRHRRGPLVHLRRPGDLQAGRDRPGEGLVAPPANATDGQLALPGTTTVAWQAYDPSGNQVGTGTAPVNPLGGFNLSVALPAGANLGPGYIQLTADVPGVPAGSAAVEPPVRDPGVPDAPSSRCSARPESPGPYFTTVRPPWPSTPPTTPAAPCPTPTSRGSHHRPTTYSPAELGPTSPSASGSRRGSTTASGAGSATASAATGCYRLLGSPGLPARPGRGGADLQRPHRHHRHALPAARLRRARSPTSPSRSPPTPPSPTSTARRWASTIDLLVHPARSTSGLRSDRTFVRQGEPLRIDAIVTDIDGNAVAGRDRSSITAARLESESSNGEWTELSTSTPQDLRPSPRPTSRCPAPSATAEVGGQYRITAVIDRRRRRTATGASSPVG